MMGRVRHLPWVLTATAVVLLGTAAIALAMRGPVAAAGVAAGVAMVAASYLLSTFAIAWADSVHVRLVMPVGMVTYIFKFTVIGIVMAGIARTGWSGLTAMGVGIVVGLITWTVAQALWMWFSGAARTHVPAAPSREALDPTLR